MLLRLMTNQDMPGCLRLNTISGWNQTAADWQRFLTQSPQGCFVMEHDDAIVGSAATVCYESRFAWIGMILVDPEYRNRGIGSELFQKAVDYLDLARIPTIKLDATPLGKPLYTKLGFVIEYEIERCVLKRPSRTSNASVASPAGNLAFSESQLLEILSLDRILFGADRGFLLRSLRDIAPQFALAVWGNGSPVAYVFGRSGLIADHLGPFMATNRDAAKNLLTHFLARSSRDTIFVDCMNSNPFAAELLRSHGFVPARPLTRMVRGPNAFPGQPDSFCAILGPEFG